MIWYVTEIDLEIDEALNVKRKYEAFESFDAAAKLFRSLHIPYQQVKPIDAAGRVHVVSGRIYKTEAADKYDAVDDVKFGVAFLINDLSYADRDPSEFHP